MGEKYRQVKVKQEEDDAEVEIWKYVLGFTKLAAVKCAIELGIAEAIENNGSPMTLSELSSALKCEPSLLQRIMRFLIHLKFFKEEPNSQEGSVAFQQTPLSSHLIRHGKNSMAALILLESSPVMLAPWHNLSARVLADGSSAFDKAHGKDVWGYAASDAAHGKLLNDAMACDTGLALPAMIKGCPEVFDGLETLVDVGGNDGTTLRTLIKAFPWIRGINFDLPHVIGVAEKCHAVELVEGDMFDSVPKADAALIKWVLHDWGDDECIQILRNCREAIPKDKGKVIIVEAIIAEDDQEEDNRFKSVGLMLDMVMMAHTDRGKERTLKEWDYVLQQAGFSSYHVKPIPAVQSIIEAFP